MSEVVGALGGAEAFEDMFQRGDNGVERSGSGAPEQRIELGEDLLDRVEFGAVGRTVEQSHAGVFEALADAVDLWAAGSSQTTMLPGGSPGMNCLVSHCWKMRPVMGVSISMGAAMPSRRRPAKNVEVIQRPCGALPSSGLPLRPPPRSRVMLGVVPVSSTNTRRLKSSSACAARQTLRAMATSGRSCSVAKIVLVFVPQPQLAHHPPDARITDLDASLGQIAPYFA